MQRIVEIIAKDKRYRMSPYPSVPYFSGTMNTYLTGQHVVPGNPDRLDFLTVEEMRKTKELTAKRQEKFPLGSIINPDDKMLIIHREKLNITPLNEAKSGSLYPGDYVNPIHFAKYRYLLEQDIVAESLEVFNPQKHYFYIHDKDIVVKQKLSARQKKWEAETYIREKITMSEYPDVCLLLNFKIPSKKFNADVESQADLFDHLLELCDTHPDIILSLNPKINPTVEYELFVLKLVSKNIIRFNNGVYSDGGKILGVTLSEVINNIQKDEMLQAKYFRLIKGNKEELANRQSLPNNPPKSPGRPPKETKLDQTIPEAQGIINEVTGNDSVVDPTQEFAAPPLPDSHME